MATHGDTTGHPDGATTVSHRDTFGHPWCQCNHTQGHHDHPQEHCDHGVTTDHPQGTRGQSGDNPAPAVPLPVNGGVAERAGVLRGQVGAGGRAPGQADAEEGSRALQGERGLWGWLGGRAPPALQQHLGGGVHCDTGQKKAPKNQISLVSVARLAGDTHGDGDTGLGDDPSRWLWCGWGGKGAAWGPQPLWDGGTCVLGRVAGLGWLCCGSWVALWPPMVTPLTACSVNMTTHRGSTATPGDPSATSINTATPRATTTTHSDTVGHPQ